MASNLKEWNMKYYFYATASLLPLISGFSYAEECRLAIEANDAMQFNQRELAVSSACEEVELTLKHVGTQSAKIMGHDWVLAKTRDIAALTSAGAAAGLANNFQPSSDARIVAGTKVVGGGESTTIKFSTAALKTNENYSFFCTAPGHSSVMKGRFKLVDDAHRVASRGSE
jgi:azurin